MEKRKRYSRLHNQIMFQLVKSVLKSLELYLTLKNKKFYYNLYKEKQEREKEITKEIEKLRENGDSGSADRADLLRQQLSYERKQFEHLSTLYFKDAKRDIDSNE